MEKRDIMLSEYKDVIATKDLCDILSISKKTAYQLLQSGEIPSRRIGRVYKIRKTAVINYLKIE